MQRLCIVATFLCLPMVACATELEAPSIYLEPVRCVGGPFGLKLPGTLPALLALSKVQREEVNEVERWEGYSATRKYLYLDGLTLGVITFSNDPNRYILTFAEISNPAWNRLLPFKIGRTSVESQSKLGTAAANDPLLRSSYGGDGDSVRFQVSGGKIRRVSYACYSG